MLTMHQPGKPVATYAFSVVTDEEMLKRKQAIKRGYIAGELHNLDLAYHVSPYDKMEQWDEHSFWLQGFSYALRSGLPCRIMPGIERAFAIIKAIRPEYNIPQTFKIMQINGKSFNEINRFFQHLSQVIA